MTLFDEVVAEHERIHVLAEETLQGLLRRVHDGLAADVERRVEQDRHPGLLAESRNQVVVERVLRPFDPLHASGAIHVVHGRDRRRFSGRVL